MCMCLCPVLQLHEVTLPSGVIKVCLTPHKPLTAVVSLKSGPPVLVDLSQDKPAVTALDILDVTGDKKQGRRLLGTVLALPPAPTTPHDSTIFDWQ